MEASLAEIISPFESRFLVTKSGIGEANGEIGM
jgi:hypothetical protein